MRMTRLAGGCIAALALVGASERASANIAHVTPGSICKAFNGNKNLAASSSGWLVNGTTSTQYVQCPIMREHPDDDIEQIFIRILDSNDSSYLPTCSANTLSNDGTVYSSTPPAEHDNPGGHDSLSIDVSDFSMPDSKGAASITCRLGRSDAILNIRVVEAG